MSRLPQVYVVLPECPRPFPHDPGGRLMKMGAEATTAWMPVVHMPKSNPVKVATFDKVLALSLQEREGWLAVRTAELPNGDMSGAAKAAMSIAMYHLIMEDYEEGTRWLDIARAEAPPEDRMLISSIRYNGRYLAALRQLEEDESRRTTPVHSRSPSPQRAADVANVEALVASLQIGASALE